ncbi:MAG TPA: hypothetical protein VHN77_06590 [Phycisphaerales bacterium]|nr:hypothetical protein [Phycisphaerales bacterium]
MDVVMAGMAPVPRTGGQTLLAGMVTILVLIATLVIVVSNTAFTKAFTDTPPQGERAMGLIIPFFGLGGAVLVMTLAGVLATLRAGSSGLGLIHSSPALSGLLAVLLTFGATLAAGAVFMLWCEPAMVGRPLKAVTAPLGIVVGIIGPLVLACALIAAVWMDKQSAVAHAGWTAFFKSSFWFVCVLALIGYGLGGAMLWQTMAQKARNQAAVLKESLDLQAKWSSHRAKPMEQRLADELAEFSPDAPLWTIVAYLPDRPDQDRLTNESRRIVIDRALRVPNLDEELRNCMTSRYYLYRQGAAELLRGVPEEHLVEHRDAWGAALEAGTYATGEGIACRPAWMTETFDSKPDPLGHVKSLLAATERFKGWEGYPRLQAELRQMAKDAAMLKPDKGREKLLRVLADAGYEPSNAGVEQPG